MKNKIIYLVLIVVLGILVCFFFNQRKPQKAFLVWDGVFSLDEYRGRSPESEDLVCIVQYAHRSSPLLVPDINGTSWLCSGPTGYKFGLPSHNIIKVYSDRESIEQILKLLKQPEHQEYYSVQSEHCLQLISLSRTFNRQYIVQVPFVLTENGYAVTPRGKDKMLYKLLISAMEEQDTQLTAEKEEREAEREKSDTIFHLYKQARESEHVDYNALFNELKKLDALHGIKDPKELEQEIQKQKEGLPQMHGSMELNQI